MARVALADRSERSPSNDAARGHADRGVGAVAAPDSPVGRGVGERQSGRRVMRTGGAGARGRAPPGFGLSSVAPGGVFAPWIRPDPSMSSGSPPRCSRSSRCCGRGCGRALRRRWSWMTWSRRRSCACSVRGRPGRRGRSMSGKSSGSCIAAKAGGRRRPSCWRRSIWGSGRGKAQAGRDPRRAGFSRQREASLAGDGRGGPIGRPHEAARRDPARRRAGSGRG